MAWAEPLVASSSTTVAPVGDQPGTRRVVVRANGVAVLACIYLFDVNSHLGVLGVVMQLNRTGTPRQRMRAFALMVRECFTSALALGITDYHAESTLRTRALAEAVAFRMEDRGDRAHAFGKLADLRTIVNAKVGANGDIATLTAARVAEIIADFGAEP